MKFKYSICEIIYLFSFSNQKNAGNATTQKYGSQKHSGICSIFRAIASDFWVGENPGKAG